MTLTAAVAGFRLGTDRWVVRGPLMTVAFFAGAGALGALAEKEASPIGSLDRALQGTVFGLVIPLAVFFTTRATLNHGRLDEAVAPLARFGASRRAVALGISLAAMAAAVAVSVAAAVITTAIAHEASGPPLPLDALTSAWIAALSACAYVGVFAFGSTFGARGGGSFVLLIFDFLAGGAGGIAALLLPRGHAANLLGGQPPLLLSQADSALGLVLIALVLTSAGVLRCRP